MYSIGPGFFIFFQEDEINAGAGTVIFYTSEQKPVKVKKDIYKEVSKKVKKYKKIKKEVSPENIRMIAETMADQWSAKPTMDKYGINYQEAVNRYKSIIAELAQLMIDDEEEAIVFILANI